MAQTTVHVEMWWAHVPFTPRTRGSPLSPSPSLAYSYGVRGGARLCGMLPAPQGPSSSPIYCGTPFICLPPDLLLPEKQAKGTGHIWAETHTTLKP